MGNDRRVHSPPWEPVLSNVALLEPATQTSTSGVHIPMARSHAAPKAVTQFVVAFALIGAGAPMTTGGPASAVAIDSGTGWLKAPTGETSTATLSARVRDFKERSGLTWSQVAALFGVSRRAVHHWVEGGNMTAGNSDRLDVLANRVAESSLLNPTQIRHWLFETTQAGRSRYANWVIETSGETVDDGRGLKEQLEPNRASVHLPRSVKRLHSTRGRLGKL